MNSPLVILERTVALHVALERAGLLHAIGGALALGYHIADPRGTRDIDLNVSIDPDHPQALFDALPAGIRWTAVDVERARRDGQVRLFWPLEDGVDSGLPIPVDLFLPQHALHAVVAGRAELVPMLDSQVPIVSATDLTIFKALFDRPKDWVDIGELLRAGKVDQEEVLTWIGEIVGVDDQRIAHLRAVAEQARRPTAGPPDAAVLFGRRQARLGD